MIGACERKNPKFIEGDGLQAVHDCFAVNAALWMTAKLMSGSVCFEPISKSALYQGHDFSRAEKGPVGRGL
jgi:hypothetical protein